MILLNILGFFAVSTEVYLILIILGIPIFFFWRWLLRKLIKNDKRRKIATWILTVVSAPLIYTGIFMLWVFCISYYPEHDFNKVDWFDEPGKRYELSKDLIESKLLIGKTKDEVKVYLGLEGSDVANQWYYNLGYRPQLFGIDPDQLIVDFEKGKVVGVRQIIK